ncbi:sodium:calcium antiporter [Natronosporangium hydrolyticum]|uniref:Sodium:calcium antiporter n=1 Tax=Natronosporangium hydrolyticum TaxID=2811111 RepID=A0A895YPA7_9ACTN|nr:sodium:calcium antiporter [Natronosporangium hydrolyticum]QSB16556.1 sodium:calcium antiporter [Natronosporangium hydrolyticum]
MLLLLLLAAAGLALLAIAADQLVIGASRAATRLRISPIVVGVVIIGLGTSAPELVVAGLAAARDEVSLALASLVGSNIVNVTLILGVAALIAPIAISSATARREAPMSVVAVALLAAAAWWGLGLGAGILLAVTTLVAIAVLVLAARRTGDPVPASVTALTTRPIRPVRESVRIVFGLAGTVGGAQLLVLSASDLAGRLGVSPEVIGFTLVAIGTSLPELVTAIQAQRRGEPDLVVGNLLGSNLFNSVAGGAVVALAAGGDPDFRLLPALLVVMVGISALAWLLLWLNYRASRRDAVLLLLVYLACLPLLA